MFPGFNMDRLGNRDVKDFIKDQGPYGKKPKPDVVPVPLWTGIKPPTWANEETQQSWQDSINQPIQPGKTEPDLPDPKPPSVGTGGRGTGRFMSREDWERRYPDRPYMTDEEGYAIDSRSDAGGPRRGQNPRMSTEISANDRMQQDTLEAEQVALEEERQAGLEGASQNQRANTASKSASSRRTIRARKTLLTQKA